MKKIHVTFPLPVTGQPGGGQAGPAGPRHCTGSLTLSLLRSDIIINFRPTVLFRLPCSKAVYMSGSEPKLDDPCRRIVTGYFRDVKTLMCSHCRDMTHYLTERSFHHNQNKQSCTNLKLERLNAGQHK